MGEPENQYLHRSSNFDLRSSSHTSLSSHRQLPYTLLYFTHPVYFAVNVAVTSTACMAEHCCTHIWSLHVLTIGEQNCVEFSLVSLSNMQKPKKTTDDGAECSLKPRYWHSLLTKCAQNDLSQWDFQNKGRCIVLEVPPCNLLTSICDFVSCDWIVQRAYC